MTFLNACAKRSPELVEGAGSKGQDDNDKAKSELP